MDVIMPQLGETVLEGSVSAWYKKVGDAVKADEPLFEVETEKVTTEVPAPAPGVLVEILVEPGVSVKVGTRLAVIESASGSVDAPGRPRSSAAAAGPRRSGAGLGQPLDADAQQSPPRRPGRLKLSPMVRRMLREHDVDP